MVYDKSMTQTVIGGSTKMYRVKIDGAWKQVSEEEYQKLQAEGHGSTTVTKTVSGGESQMYRVQINGEWREVTKAEFERL